MRAVLILNAAAGSMAALNDPRALLEAAIEAAGFTIIARPDDAQTPDRQWDAAVAAAPDAVFVAGGDGTLRAIATLALGSDIALGLLPGGTMNRVCQRLGLPPDPVAAVASYRPGQTAGLDIVRLNGEIFLYQSLIGAPARLLRFRELQRGGGLLGWLPLLRVALRNLVRTPWNDVVAPMPGRRHRRGNAAVVTAPAPGAPSALTLQLVRSRGILGRLRQAFRWFTGRLAQDPDVLTHESPRLVVHGRRRRIRVSLDGEMMLATPPLRFRLDPGALRILDPRP
ncbi:diacylglycerol/lipid kinase family protein [Humitalea sp. 24SJ18S-53]|uniref:diacylglycerol/lipid kinase family protein n=1 Tax=Humitalea sp. 24SJ18S-53 TaxID=3422307 RepID=UPI003D667B48